MRVKIILSIILPIAIAAFCIGVYVFVSNEAEVLLEGAERAEALAYSRRWQECYDQLDALDQHMREVSGIFHSLLTHNEVDAVEKAIQTAMTNAKMRDPSSVMENILFIKQSVLEIVQRETPTVSGIL